MTSPQLTKTILLIFLFTFLSFLSLTLDHYPDHYGTTHTPAGHAYMGQVSWFDPWDISVYISAIRWGGRDGWLFKNVYTTIDQPGAPIFHIYLLLGKIGKVLNLSPQMMFHAGATVLSIPFLIFLIYFTHYFTRSNREWLLAFYFCVLGGGFGWLLYPQLPIPDVFVPGFTIETALHRPHEALSSLFYIVLMLFSYKALSGSDLKGIKGLTLLILGITTFLLAFQHPYMLLPYFLVLGAFSIYLFKVRPFGRSRSELLKSFIPVYIVTLGASALYALLSFKLFITNPSFGGLLGQIQKSANPVLMMLGYGILAPFIIYKLLKNTSTTKTDFLRLWFLVQFATLYLPLGFQRLLIRGLLYPAFVLAAMGAVEVMRKNKRFALPLLFLLILLAPLSSFYVFRRRIADIPNLNRWMYLTVDEKKAFDFLETQPKERTVLASYRVSNHLPPHTNSWVYAGHEFQSPDFYARQKEVQRFYGGKMSEEEMKEWLKENNIQYVFYGQEERAINLGKSLSIFFLEEKFNTHGVIVYKVKYNPPHISPSTPGVE